MKLIWLDLETTGLDPIRDHILEVAWAVAEIERPFDIGPMKSHVLRCTQSFIDTFSPFIREMHTKNGLIDELPSGDSFVDVFRNLLEDVPEVEDKEDKPTLAGASVHFDLGFLRANMPGVAGRLSHRVYDTSAVKLFCRSMGMPKPLRGEAHRAASDVLEAVQQAKDCAAWLRLGNWRFPGMAAPYLGTPGFPAKP